MAYSMDILYSPDDTGSQYYEGQWINEEYRTIDIKGGEYADDVELITFLKANATLISTSYVYTKLSWTKEEIKDTYVLKLDDFSIGGEVYTKYGYTKDLLIKMSYYDKILVIDKYEQHLLFYKQRTEIENGEPYIVAYNLLEGTESNILYLNLDEVDNYSISIGYFYLTDAYRYDNLANTVPNDAYIVEDQGKLKLKLAHNGNILKVNDTPNQFLQRNLNKPAFRWNGSSSEPPLVDALNNVWNNVGKRLCFIVLENNSTFNTSRPRIWCVGEWDGQVFNITPLVPVPVTLNGNVSLCQYLTITPLTASINLSYIEGFKFADGSYESAYNLGSVGVDHLQLF